MNDVSTALASDAVDKPCKSLRALVRKTGTRNDQALFFQAWLSQPLSIGAVMPTRPPLARAMARAITSDRPVLELGGGTGSITRALVEFGVRHLTVVERNPTFHRLLSNRFPGFRVLCANAEDLDIILPPRELGEIGTVVSSLPRIGWPMARQRSILELCFAALHQDGAFLEFSYGPASPVPGQLVKELGLTARRLHRLWGNFPPASIWEYRR
jgi:phosphatidylethanolamine/phosphatidyl-N-methylethanolamine N-methyltransferase